MDIQKIVKNYVRRVNAQSLSGNVSIINESNLTKLLTKMVEKEMDKLQREKKALQSQVDKLTGVVQTQREQLLKPQAAEVNVEAILAGIDAKMSELKEDMREEIQRQTALSKASKAGGVPVVDMQAFLDRLFEGDDLETNIKVVKQAKSKMSAMTTVDKLKEMRDQ